MQSEGSDFAFRHPENIHWFTWLRTNFLFYFLFLLSSLAALERQVRITILCISLQTLLKISLNTSLNIPLSVWWPHWWELQETSLTMRISLKTTLKSSLRTSERLLSSAHAITPMTCVQGASHFFKGINMNQQLAPIISCVQASNILGARQRNRFSAQYHRKGCFWDEGIQDWHDIVLSIHWSGGMSCLQASLWERMSWVVSCNTLGCLWSKLRA